MKNMLKIVPVIFAALVLVACNKQLDVNYVSDQSNVHGNNNYTAN
jgi:uncharacterized protein YcfL